MCIWCGRYGLVNHRDKRQITHPAGGLWTLLPSISSQPSRSPSVTASFSFVSKVIMAHVINMHMIFLIWLNIYDGNHSKRILLVGTFLLVNIGTNLFNWFQFAPFGAISYQHKTFQSCTHSRSIELCHVWLVLGAWQDNFIEVSGPALSPGGSTLGRCNSHTLHPFKFKSLGAWHFVVLKSRCLRRSKFQNLLSPSHKLSLSWGWGW